MTAETREWPRFRANCAMHLVNGSYVRSSIKAGVLQMLKMEIIKIKGKVMFSGEIYYY